MQCTLILLSSIPTRISCSTNQKDLSQTSVSAFRTRTEFNYLKLKSYHSISLSEVTNIAVFTRHFFLTASCYSCG